MTEINKEWFTLIQKEQLYKKEGEVQGNPMHSRVTYLVEINDGRMVDSK